MDTTVMTSDLARYLPPLLHQAGVQGIRLQVLTKRPSFRGGDVSEAAQAVTKAARDDHRRHHFGFWEFALRASLDTDPATREALIDGALRHSPAEPFRSALTLAEFTRRLRADEFSSLASRTIVCVTSQVDAAAGDDHHIPMLDLGAPVSPEGEAACVDSIRALGLTGLLFDSGTSYHFYGDRLVGGREFQVLLATAQLLSPIIDSRWISHQMIDGRAALRISTDDERHPAPHRLVASVA